MRAKSVLEKLHFHEQMYINVAETNLGKKGHIENDAELMKGKDEGL